MKVGLDLEKYEVYDRTSGASGRLTPLQFQRLLILTSGPAYVGFTDSHCLFPYPKDVQTGRLIDVNCP